MSLTIAKWLPLENEEIQMLFTECKQLQVESEGLIQNLAIFLCDLKYNNIRKTQNNSIDIPFSIEVSNIMRHIFVTFLMIMLHFLTGFGNYCYEIKNSYRTIRYNVQ